MADPKNMSVIPINYCPYSQLRFEGKYISCKQGRVSRRPVKVTVISRMRESKLCVAVRKGGRVDGRLRTTGACVESTIWQCIPGSGISVLEKGYYIQLTHTQSGRNSAGR